MNQDKLARILQGTKKSDSDCSLEIHSALIPPQIDQILHDAIIHYKVIRDGSLYQLVYGTKKLYGLIDVDFSPRQRRALIAHATGDQISKLLLEYYTSVALDSQIKTMNDFFLNTRLLEFKRDHFIDLNKLAGINIEKDDLEFEIPRSEHDSMYNLISMRERITKMR